MIIKDRSFFLALKEAQKKMVYFLFNMVNDPLTENLYLIKTFNNKCVWENVLIWDNQKEKLYGPFYTGANLKMPGEVLEGYKWTENLLYLYYGRGNDACVAGLMEGKEITCEEC